MTPRLTPASRAILVAMISRAKPLVRGDHHWFVPDWRASIRAKDVEALRDAGLVTADGSRSGRVLQITPFGRSRAEASMERRAG
jgi:hypothetical protein